MASVRFSAVVVAGVLLSGCSPAGERGAPPQPPSVREGARAQTPKTPAVPAEAAASNTPGGSGCCKTPEGSLIQYKCIDASSRPDGSPREPEYNYGDAKAGEGVVGGVGGANTVEEAPAFATAGYTKPAEREKGCVGRSVRWPRELAGIVGGATVKFAVGRDGKPSRFEVLTDLPDPRMGAAIWQAIQSCPFSPGLDTWGRPQLIWMILPLKFAAQPSR